jgi:RNA 3'-terminal phosphate cyclase (ATP)
LKTVEAASAVGMATVEGAKLGSQVLVFEPSGIVASDFHFDIGTAGSTSLLLQTVIPALSFARAASTVTVLGGTHVPWSPSFHFLELHWLPYMRQIGFHAQLELQLAGFYPFGGGRVCARVQPATNLSPLSLLNRGALKRIEGISAVANLDMTIAARQKARALHRLSAISTQTEIELFRLRSPVRGTFLLLRAVFENSQCCFSALGALGKRAERVADEAVDQLLEFLDTDGAIEHYLADQLALPLALAPGTSEVRTSKVTQHLCTNARIIKMFLPVVIDIQGKVGKPGLLRIMKGS